MNLRRIVTFVGSLLLGAGCVTSGGTEDAKARLLETDREWSRVAADSRDVERIVAFWTDDAEIVAPGAPVIRGKAAIREFVTQSLAVPGFRISWRPEAAAVSADGTLGYTRE